MEDTWIKEAFQDCADWERQTKIDNRCHLTAVLGKCNRGCDPYTYADQVWHTTSTGYRKYGLIPILH
jgi:hypothetical protein